jgi:hypothetical protein
LKKQAREIRKLKEEKENFNNFEALVMIKENDESANYIDYSEYQFRRHGSIMRFFDKTLSRWVNKMKIPIILIGVTWFVCAMWLGFHIPKQIGKETLLGKSSPIQQAKDIMDY